MTKFEVIFYEKEDGECPVEQFLSALDLKMRVKWLVYWKYWRKKGICSGNHTAGIWMTEFMRSDVKLEIILPECCTFFIMEERLFLQTGL